MLSGEIALINTHYYYNYMGASTLVHLSVFEFASIYLTLVRSH